MVWSKSLAILTPIWISGSLSSFSFQLENLDQTVFHFTVGCSGCLSNGIKAQSTIYRRMIYRHRLQSTASRCIWAYASMFRRRPPRPPHAVDFMHWWAEHLGTQVNDFDVPAFLTDLYSLINISSPTKVKLTIQRTLPQLIVSQQWRTVFLPYSVHLSNTEFDSLKTSK